MKRRSNCPLSCALEIIGDKWTLLILRDMILRKKKNYKEFIASREGISTNILASRLKLLVDQGILEKTISADNKLIIDYSLTEKGKELGPVILSIAKWGEKHIPQTSMLGI